MLSYYSKRFLKTGKILKITVHFKRTTKNLIILTLYKGNPNKKRKAPSQVNSDEPTLPIRNNEEFIIRCTIIASFLN